MYVDLESLRLSVNLRTARARLGPRRPALGLPLVLGLLSKGEARRVRKALRRAGAPALAALGCR